jgi:hypothetical protein
MPEEFSSVKEVHDKVEFIVCLESVVKINDEGVLDLLQYLPFSYT